MQNRPPRPSERLSGYARSQGAEKFYTKTTNKVTALNKAETTRILGALNLTREEKVSIAGSLAELTDMCTTGNHVSSLEAEPMTREVKRLLTDWGIPSAYTNARLAKPALLAGLELLALATVVSARATGK